MDVSIIDVPWNGILEAMKIAAMAEAFEVNCAPHNFYGNMSMLMSAHFCAAIPNFEHPAGAGLHGRRCRPSDVPGSRS
jgi:galactonate dehydratase